MLKGITFLACLFAADLGPATAQAAIGPWDAQKVTEQVATSCSIGPGFVSVEKDTERRARVQVSPTVLPAQARCVVEAVRARGIPVRN